MSRRKRVDVPLSQRPVPELVRSKCRPPIAVVLGSPAEVAHVLHECNDPSSEAVCYQMDLHQAGRVEEELRERGVAGRVVTTADLWDLPAEFQTVLYLPARGGERELKIDMVEQAFHILRPGGLFLVWSSYEKDPFFQTLIKKIFGRTHVQSTDSDTVLWSHREGDRPRRRHEMTFQARIAGGPSCRFLSRPGTFSYGRFDEGARALSEVMEIDAGDRVLDVGCGCGTNGVFAWQRCGPEGFVAFVDSNVRALALAEHNAQANGVESFRVVASSRVAGLTDRSFDVALANPPYFANSSIARLFIDRSLVLLKPEGRFYMVTKQLNEMAALLEETFGAVQAVMRRGYTILCA
jgi:16S rRNA G1207 methylase RsmC